MRKYWVYKNKQHFHEPGHSLGEARDSIIERVISQDILCIIEQESLHIK